MENNTLIKLSLLLDSGINGRCSSCSREFNILEEFVEEKEFNEYYLSGLCKICQDNLFKRGE